MKVDPCGMGVSGGNGWLRSFADAQAASPITWQTCFGKRANAALKTKPDTSDVPGLYLADKSRFICVKLQNSRKKWNYSPCVVTVLRYFLYVIKKVNTGSDFKALLRSTSPVRIKKSGDFLILMSVLCKNSGFLWFFPFGIKKNEDFLILVGVSWHIV